MVPRLLKTVLGLPLKIVRRALKQWTFSKPEIIPVGGLTPEVSSELLFALRQAATTAEVSYSPSEVGLTASLILIEQRCHDAMRSDSDSYEQDERIVCQWLSALELAQVTSDR